ncbi:hypothetical protein N8192_00425 [bacterium]|nr:hypothetical protein [bacterium]
MPKTIAPVDPDSFAAQILAFQKKKTPGVTDKLPWNQGPPWQSSPTASEDSPGVIERALQQYKILQQMNLKGMYTPGVGKYGNIESWQPGEPGTTGYERPKDIPLNTFGVQVFQGGKTKPIDVLADAVSHQLVNTDPVLKKYYQGFKDSLTPKQKEKLQLDYKHAKEVEGETRPFEQWAEISRLPSFFRGYTFNQWPDEFNKQVFTPQQIKMFDQVRKYLGVNEPNNTPNTPEQ